MHHIKKKNLPNQKTKTKKPSKTFDTVTAFKEVKYRVW